MSRALIAGRATVDGTASLARRFGAVGRRLGRSELIVTPIGFGAYRVHGDAALGRQALEEALRAGVNLIDTSTNYGVGASERLCGEVLATLFTQEVITRAQVVVVSKIGYLQGPTLEAARRRERPYPEVVLYQRECWHCIHPEFLEDQLSESLARLGLETIDVLLLHNPEYFLIERRGREGEVGDDDRSELYRRIGDAFAFLEEAVQSGRIGAYGVSSNSLGAPIDDPDFVSLARLEALARGIAGDDHHFAVVQTPFNLYEGGALRERQATPAGPRSTLEIAAEADLGVMVNRPLSAFVQGDGEARMIRLAEVGAREEGRTPDPEPLLRAVQDLEARWRQDLGRDLAESSGDPRFVDLFRWGSELEQGMAALRDLGHWMQLRNGVIATHMGQLGGILLSTLQGEELARFRRFWEDYGAILGAALDGIEDVFRARARAVVDLIGDRLAPALPESLHGLPLSQKAVLTLLAAPVSVVLVGMRRPAYVHDMVALAPELEALARGDLRIDVDAAIEAFAAPAIH